MEQFEEWKLAFSTMIEEITYTGNKNRKTNEIRIKSEHNILEMCKH